MQQKKTEGKERRVNAKNAGWGGDEQLQKTVGGGAMNTCKKNMVWGSTNKCNKNAVRGCDGDKKQKFVMMRSEK